MEERRPPAPQTPGNRAGSQGPSLAPWNRAPRIRTPWGPASWLCPSGATGLCVWFDQSQPEWVQIPAPPLSSRRTWRKALQLFLIYHTPAMAAQLSDKDTTSHLSSINVGSSPHQAVLRVPEMPSALSFPPAPGPFKFSHRLAIYINFGSVPNLASMTTKCKA